MGKAQSRDPGILAGDLATKSKWKAKVATPPQTLAQYSQAWNEEAQA